MPDWERDDIGWFYRAGAAKKKRRGFEGECDFCGKSFIGVAKAPESTTGRFCSRLCSNRGTKPKRHRRGSDNPKWMGGHINAYGYRVVSIPGGNKLEHRIVMEQVLGRELLSHETVHHKNGVKLDNRPENLELWSSRHPKGERSSDLVSWAHEILAAYA